MRKEASAQDRQKEVRATGQAAVHEERRQGEHCRPPCEAAGPAGFPQEGVWPVAPPSNPGCLRG